MKIMAMPQNERFKDDFLRSVSKLLEPSNPQGEAFLVYLRRTGKQLNIRNLDPLEIINDATVRGLSYIDENSKEITNSLAWLRKVCVYIMLDMVKGEKKQRIISQLDKQYFEDLDLYATISQGVFRESRGHNYYYDEVLLEDILPLRMMLVSPGSLLMGSPLDELERTEAESPQHQVTISQFFMAKYPVTQAQWRVVANLPKVERVLDSAPAYFQGENRPVEQVSWHEAVEFCIRLTLLTKRQYRLPTESEWEYACRAGTITPFHFGATLSTEHANYNGANEEHGVYGPGNLGEYRQETTPVDQFEGSNAFGLHDMHGNVWEWCQDYWHKNYEGAPADGRAWIENGDSENRALRGGSWYNEPKFCRSAYRSFNKTDLRLSVIGFRVCCSSSEI
jgi:formylglycine-generating enzyme required for sulfatase activity